jgi:o-succinylbenzoate synthase
MVVPPGGDLDSISLYRVRLPLLEPFVTAHGVEREREVTLVRVAAGDLEGWGECAALAAPTYTDEFAAASWSALCETLAPTYLMGGEWRDESMPMTTAALDTALVDLDLRRRSVRLSEHVGGSRGAVESCAVVGVADTLTALVETIGRRVEDGHRLVKLKIHPSWDVAPLTTARQHWPELGLAADANGSYPSASDVPDQLDRLGLIYLEQPLGRSDLEGSRDLARSFQTKLALDESVTSPGAAIAALDLGAASVVNIKPARLGGLDVACEVARIVADHGAESFVGGMLETGIGRAAALGVASLPSIELPTDLGPSSRYFAEDITDPFALVDGRLEVPTEPGIGRRPRPDRFDRFLVEYVELT